MFASFALLMMVQAAATSQAAPPAPVRTATAPSPTDVVVEGRTTKRGRSVDMGDPNRIVCREVKNTGSRLKQTKNCAPAWRWAEERRLNQSTIETTTARKWSSSQ